MLPPLLRKAVGDSGFDLALGADAEWERFAVGGLEGNAWIIPSRAGALLAVDSEAVLGDFQTVTWTDVPLPRGAAGAIRCNSPADLYHALRRMRVLLGSTPPRPVERFRQRLASITTTEAESVVRRRVGQELFREMLMDYWEGRCAVTGLAVPELLRASHAKPWKDSTDEERLDVHNGLLLAVHLDALFDAGLMTFLDDGTACFARALSEDARRLLCGGQDNLRLIRIAAGHRRYLAYHRAVLFRNGSMPV